MNLYADIRGGTPADEDKIEAARAQLAAYWPRVNPGMAHVETITREMRMLGYEGRAESVLTVKWGTR